MFVFLVQLFVAFCINVTDICTMKTNNDYLFVFIVSLFVYIVSLFTNKDYLFVNIVCMFGFIVQMSGVTGVLAFHHFCFKENPRVLKNTGM
jgi:hypothetical protein